MTQKSLLLNHIESWQIPSKSMLNVNGYVRKAKQATQRLHFLHGTGFSAMTFAAMASQLPADWELWFTDVPGHGRSSQPSSKMPNWQKMANTVADALYKQADVENKGPLIGIGHSMGAVLTLFIAAKYPNLFSRIILLDPVLFKTEMIVAQQLMRLTGAWKHRALVRSVSNRRAHWPNKESMRLDLISKPFYRQWHPQVIDDFIHYASEKKSDQSLQLCCDPHWEASIFGSYPKGLWRAARHIDLPVNILVANKTYFFIPTAVKRAAKVNKNIRWKKFGEHHCFPMEQPVATAEIITSLIERN
jgi:pimeloyl-ACP methyl ester carboxylesterase